MQISVEQTSELVRKITVSIPESTIQEKMEARYKKLAREVKVAGFRPGKVPVQVVKQMYADRVGGEVRMDLLESSYNEALTQNKLHPAGQPHINFVEKAEGEGMEYTAEIEVYPEISLDNLNQIEITRLLASVTEADVDAMINKLRKQKQTFNEVERAAQDKDRVTIHFSGVSEDENFTDGKTENFVLEIGSNRMIPGFEDELKGLKVGDSKTFSINFPTPYHNDKLAGKPAEFTVEMVKVEEPILPEVTEDFIRSYGIEEGTMDAFRADVRGNMERQLGEGLSNELKNAALTAIYENMNITLPKALIDEEIKALMKPYEEQAKRRNMRIDDLDLPADYFEEQAKRRVTLGLVLSDIVTEKDIKLDHDRVRETIESMAQNYEQPASVVAWYYEDKNRLREVQQMVLENQVVDWVVAQAKVSDKNVAFNDILLLDSDD